MRSSSGISAKMMVVLVLWRSLTAGAEAPPAPVSGADLANLTLADLIKMVLHHNEDVQVKLIDFAASRSKAQSEWGAFEPQAYGSVNYQADNRQNSSIQAASLLSQPFYHATNITYESGLESTLVTGTRLRGGYSLTNIRDNLQPALGFTHGEYQSFFGFSATQPLARNLDPAVNLAPVRIAALSSKIAFQEYRRQLTSVLSAAEASYWNLYLAQEEVRYFEDSVKTAGIIVDDFRYRLEAGTGAQIDVLEAQSGLALRRAKLNEARQKMLEAANQVVALYAGRTSEHAAPVHAVDAPNPASKPLRYEELGFTAMQLNPDYLIQQRKAEQEQVRLRYAGNQRLPDVDLKGSYGLNGLAASPDQSWNATLRDHLASWSFGIELHVPLDGDIKARNLYRAAQLQYHSAVMACNSLRSQILAGLDTAWHKLDAVSNSINDYQTTVKYNQALLDSALTRLRAGQIESGKVLEIEGDLLEARSDLAQSLARHQVAYLEMEVLEGALLRDHHVDLTQQSLQDATRRLAFSRAWTEEEYDLALARLLRLYDQAQPSAAHSPLSTNAVTGLPAGPGDSSAGPSSDKSSRP